MVPVVGGTVGSGAVWYRPATVASHREGAAVPTRGARVSGSAPTCGGCSTLIVRTSDQRLRARGLRSSVLGGLDAARSPGIAIGHDRHARVAAHAGRQLQADDVVRPEVEVADDRAVVARTGSSRPWSGSMTAVPVLRVGVNAMSWPW